ncbi:MAG: hypothetical protein HYS08_09190, partial [Chlamydiae bacterium]|nr:hypothetical protein [Chlamydiota bacterium]
AENLTSGTIPDARLNTTVIRGPNASFIRTDNITWLVTSLDNVTIERTYNKTWNRTNGNVYLANNLDNLGIGNSTPLFKVQIVEDDNNISETAYILALDHNIANQSNGSANIASGLLFRAEDSSGEIENASLINALLTTATNGTEASALAFLTRTGGNALTERMRIDGSGNVGIGTTTPGAKLDVAGPINATALNISGNLQVGGNANISNGLNVSGNVIIMNGNVGIGTTGPGAKLHVTGGRTLLVPTAEAYALGLGRSEIGNYYYLGVTNDASPHLVFSNNAGTERMRIQDNGNVGIGTTTPGALLDVYGNINATGLNLSTSLRLNNAINMSSDGNVLISGGFLINGVNVSLHSGIGAENLTSGTIPDARLNTTVIRGPNASFIRTDNI